MSARLILADEPGAWISFTSRGREYRARMDPMWLGADMLPKILKNPRLVWRLFDDESQMRAMTSDPFGTGVVVMLGDYLKAVGLEFRGLVSLNHALENLSLVEVDLLRMGLDVADWLNPEGPLSSRRVALLVEDFLDRPETRLGAKHKDFVPIDKAAIVLAQILSGMSGEKGHTHSFLKSPETLAKESEDLRIAREKRERVSKQAPRELQSVARSGSSFLSAQEESQRALNKILADQAST